MTLFDYLVAAGASVEKRIDGTVLTLNGKPFVFSDNTYGLWVGEWFYYANPFNLEIDDEDIPYLNELLNDQRFNEMQRLPIEGEWL